MGKRGTKPDSGEMLYKTTCLDCGWHKDCAVPYTERTSRGLCWASSNYSSVGRIRC